MKRFTKYLAAIFAVALLGALMAGCSGQAASSASSASGSASASSASASASASASSASASASAASASASGSAASVDALLAELEGLQAANTYKSVTMDMQGNISIDAAALAGTETTDSAASAPAEPTIIPMNILAKADMSTGVTQMSMNINTMGVEMQLYVNGDNAVMVSGGQAIGATLEELNMAQYKDIDSIMASQGADLDKIKDAITDIKKDTKGDLTVYSLICDPAKFMSTSDMSTLSQFGDLATLNDVVIEYQFSADGKLAVMDMVLTGTAFSMDVIINMSDYDTTVVDPAPEPTMNYSDLVNSIAGSGEATEASAEAASQDAAA